MSRIIWNEVGKRRFESGVSNGVLYPPGGPGVPWNGLISVQEDPEGGTVTPFHFDGIKYGAQYSGEDFQATVEAYTFPAEMGFLDGSVRLAPGLYATAQPRRTQFGLCYRSGIGNDVQGVDAGYLLHLVYNATAEATSKTRKTRDANVSPQNFQWKISAVPPESFFYKPTAHFVIDSTETDPRVMEVLEQRLYGVDTNVPYLPTQDFVIELMNAMVKSVDGGTPAMAGAVLLDGGSPGSPSPNSYDGGEADTLTVENYVYS